MPCFYTILKHGWCQPVGWIGIAAPCAWNNNTIWCIVASQANQGLTSIQNHQNGTRDTYNCTDNFEDAILREDVDCFNAECRINTQIGGNSWVTTDKSVRQWMSNPELPIEMSVMIVTRQLQPRQMWTLVLRAGKPQRRKHSCSGGRRGKGGGSHRACRNWASLRFPGVNWIAAQWWAKEERKEGTS